MEKKFVRPEGMMKIDFDPNMWDLVERGVLPVTETLALVQLNNGAEAKVAVYIEGGKLIDVGENSPFTFYKLRKPESGENYFEQAFSRIMFELLLFTTFGSKNWIIYGYVKAGGGVKSVPILILYSESLKHAFYSMKCDTDNDSPSGNEDKSSKFTPWMN